MASKAEKIADVLDRLEVEYGPRQWTPRGRPLDVFVSIMLSQNTSWPNAREGFRRLKRYLPTWEKVLAADVNTIQRCIAVCGLGRMRAWRILALLRRVKQERGRLSLAFVGRMSVEDASQYLSSFHGVGPKTVACALLFGFGMPVFPVDNGVMRLARRLGWVRAKAREAEVQTTVEKASEPEKRYALHTLMYQHAKEICRPKNPKCDECVLLDICPSGKRRRKHAPAKEEPTRPRRPSRFISAGLARDDADAPRRVRR